MPFKTRLTAAISYFSFLFLLIAYLIYRKDRNGFLKVHVNQGLNLNLFAIIVIVLQNVAVLEKVGVAFSFVILIFMIWGMVYAFMGKETKIPVLGAFELIS